MPDTYLVMEEADDELAGFRSLFSDSHFPIKKAALRSKPYGPHCVKANFKTLIMLLSLFQKTENGEPIKLDGTEISYNIFMHSILPKLIDENKATDFFWTEETEREHWSKLDCLAAALSQCTPRTTSGLFSSSIATSYEFGWLIDAAFNADLPVLKEILESNKNKPRKLQALLCTPGEVTHEGLTSRGTALEFALMCGDEEMAQEIAQYLDPTEIARQFKNVFGPDYTAFLKQQEEDAESLFEGLEAAFKDATETEVRNALNYVPNTPSALQQKIAAFKTKLKEYVNKTHPLHNDFILAKAFEMYDRNWDPWSGVLICLFSQKVIGLTQASTLKTSIKRSMDIAEGIYNRAKNIDKHLPARRSLLLDKSTTDIRSVVDLGSRCCIDIFGRARVAQCSCRDHAAAHSYKNCVEQTHQLWKTYAHAAAIEVTPVSQTPRLLGDVR